VTGDGALEITHGFVDETAGAIYIKGNGSLLIFR